MWPHPPGEAEANLRSKTMRASHSCGLHRKKQDALEDAFEDHKNPTFNVQAIAISGMTSTTKDRWLTCFAQKYKAIMGMHERSSSMQLFTCPDLQVSNNMKNAISRVNFALNPCLTLGGNRAMQQRYGLPLLHCHSISVHARSLGRVRHGHAHKMWLHTFHLRIATTLSVYCVSAWLCKFVCRECPVDWQ